MTHKNKIIFSLNIMICSYLHGQSIDCYDSSFVQTDNQLSGSYWLYDYTKDNEEMTFRPSNLHIVFNSDGKFDGKAGNNCRGRYHILDSNKIRIKRCNCTAAAFTAKTSKGYIYDLDIFMYVFEQCDSFSIHYKEIKFYQNSEYKISLRPYPYVLGFPNRDTLQENYIKIIAIDSLKFPGEYILINSLPQFKKYTSTFDVRDIDFDKQSLLLIKNKNLSEMRGRQFKDLRKWANADKRNPLPVSYAKVYQDLDQNIQLDIINTFYRAAPDDRFRTSKYSGYIIEKTSKQKLKINITYSE